MTRKMISEGAEAQIFLEDDKITKERIKKDYRLSKIDKSIRKRRTRREARLLLKAKKAKINTPEIYNIDNKQEPTEKYILELEYIKGQRLSETLNRHEKNKQDKIIKDLGEEVAKMHNNNIIHGDLTTSNTILRDGKVYLIDFGLGYSSHKVEDKAVDLHLIKQALEARHHKRNNELFEAFLKGYAKKGEQKTIERLKEVEKRGRYKRSRK